MAYDDPNNDYGGDYTASTGMTGGYDPYAQIRQLYSDVTGGKYQPTDAELHQWGTNIDSNYLNKIHDAISGWWSTYQQNNPATTTNTGTTTGTGTSTGAGTGTGTGTGTGGGGLDGTLGGLLGPFTQTYTPPPQLDLGGPQGLAYVPTAPTFTAPSYTPPPAYQAPAPFSYAAFTAPTLADAQNEPGYQFAKQEGEGALQASAAAKGVLNTGGTLKDILGWGNKFAEQNYGNVFNRALQGYGTNFNTALTAYNTNADQGLKAYNTNYQTQYVDPYKFAYQSALDAFAPKQSQWQTIVAAAQHQNDANQNNAWNQYLGGYDIFRNNGNDLWNRIYQTTTAQ